MAPDNYFLSDQQLRNQQYGENISGITHQDGLYNIDGGSSLHGVSSNFCNSGAQMPYQIAQYAPGSINISVQSHPTNSGTSFDESSLITGVDSSFFGGSYTQGPGFNRTDSHASISGSSTVNQFSPQGQGVPFQNHTSMPQFSVPVHNASASPVMRFKKPGVEEMPGDVLHPNYQQQMSHLQGMQMKSFNDRPIDVRFPQLSPHQQQLSAHQQQLSPHQQQLSAHQQQNVANSNKRTMFRGGMAIRRLTSYVHQRRQRPPDNNIEYWRTFVAHFYSPDVLRRTCFSKHSNVSSQGNGAFTMEDTWSCELCGSTPGKGYVETFEVLPRMNQLYFSKDVIDELLYLNSPTEKMLPDGSVMVYFDKAVQEAVYKHCRVIHEGKLRVIFTSKFQIISWIFCVQKHEVFLPRRLITHQVNDLVKIATSLKNNADAIDSDGVTEKDLSSNGNRMAAAERSLAGLMEQPEISDLGFSKHFLRSLQVSEVLENMKDLMAFSMTNNTSPIETLSLYGRKAANDKFETRQMESRLPIPQTPGPPVRRNFPAQNAHLTGKTDRISPAANYMAQAPVSYGNQVCNTPSPNKNFPVPQQMRDGVSPFSPSYQSPISPAQSSPDPSAAQRSPIYADFMLNDILSKIRSEGTKRARSKTTGRRCNATSDPVGEDGHTARGWAKKKSRLHASQPNNELSNGQVLGGKPENGKGLNSSSSSNSSKFLPDHNFSRKDTDLDEDFTSPAQSQGSFKTT